jgi:hypothetical protein
MKRITAILILTFVCQFNTSFAQTKTPYQKKVDQIMTEMCKAIGVESSLIQMAVKLNDWDIVRTSQDLAFKSKMLDRNELLVIILATEQKLKDAEKLKNSVDLKIDAEKKAKEDNEKMLIEEKKQKEIQIQEEKKKQEQIALQKERELQNARRIEEEKKQYFDNSDYVSIINDVSTKFDNWLKKGEFEKTEDFNNRLEFRQMIFDSICHKIILEEIDHQMNPEIELGQYNPDKEYFPVVISYRKLNFKDTININIADAEKFKNQTQSYSIIFSEKEQDWTIIDYYFSPLRMYVKNVGDKPLIEIIVPYDTPHSPLNLSTKEMKLSYYNFEELNYQFDKYEQKRAQFLKEKKLKDFQNSVKKAEDFEKSGNLQESLKFYKNALVIDPNSSSVQSKTTEITNKINEINRSKLILEAEELYKNGKLTSSMQKYLEANKIRNSKEITDLISIIENSISSSKQKHYELLSQYNKAEGSQSLSKYSKMNDDLENLKNGYGLKYNICLDTINSKINNQKSNIKTQYAEYLKSQNKEVWSDENGKILDLITSFNVDYQKLKTFENNIFKALQNEDKKFLKILKEDNINDIIETVIKTN